MASFKMPPQTYEFLCETLQTQENIKNWLSLRQLNPYLKLQQLQG